MVRSSLTQGHVDRVVSTEKSGNSSIHLWVKYPNGNAGNGNLSRAKPWALSELAAKQARHIRFFHLRNVPDVHISALCCALPTLPPWGMHREEKCRGEQLFVVCVSFHPSV